MHQMHWERMEDAEASMKKFMGDASVADFANMIDGNSMKMARYDVADTFKGTNSDFIEVMSFNAKEGKA